MADGHQLGYAKPESQVRTLRDRLPYIVAGTIIGVLAGLLCSMPARLIMGWAFDRYGRADDVNRRVNEALAAMIVTLACVVVVGIIGALLGNRWGRSARSGRA